MILKPPKGKLIIPGKPINQGLVGYWLMNEGGGNLVQDVSGNGNHGTITGATWVPGEFGPCLAMGGSGSVGAGDIEVLDGCSALTLSIWCMATTSTFPVTGVLINKDDGASRGFYLRVATTEVVSATIYNSAGSSGAVTSSTDLFKNDVGTWRHIAVVWDGLTVTLYINGVPDGTPASLSGVMRSNAYSVGIGTNWPGSIDVPLIFNRALSPAEIAELYRDPFVGSRREPIELWGSRSAPTEISSWTELAAMDLAADAVLTKDLGPLDDDYADYAGAAANENTGWLPIGTGTNEARFSGTFDGQGHSISGLVIARSDNYQGLFGSVSGTVKNVDVLDASVTVTGSKTYVGVLCGRNYGTISGCTVSGTVSNDYRWTGGLVGVNKGGATISDCHSSVTVTGGADNTGGFVGTNQGSISDSSTSGAVTGASGAGGFVGQNAVGTIDQCLATGNVIGSSYVGGFVGYNNGSAGTTTIRDCYSQGTVTCKAGGTETHVGGFGGYNLTAVCINCYSTGSVHFTDIADPTNRGFFAINAGTATNCFWDTQTSGQSTSSGGTAKTTAQMQTLSTFTDAGWDIVAIASYDDETWFIDAGVDYPRLGWEYEEAGANYTGSGSVTVDKATVSASGTYTSSYTGSGSVIVQQPTASGSGTYATPVYTGSGSPQVTKVTASGAGTFTAPIYAGAGSVTVSKATASGSGLFANAFYSGSGGGTVRPPVAAGTGTFTVPAYSGVGDVSVTKVTASGTGLFATAIYSGLGDVEVSKATAVGSGTFTVPTYECAGNVSIQKATVAGAGTFVVPTYEGYGSVSATKIVAAGSGLFATAIYNGSGDIAVSKVTVVGSGTFTVPTYSGSGSVSATKVTVVGSGLFAAEMYVGSISVTIARVEAVGVGTFAVPVYDGNGSVVVPQPAASGSGSFTAPVYSGLGVAVIRKATASGSGLHGLIFSGYGSVDTQRATASGAGTFFASGVSVASIFLLLKRKH